MVPFSQVSSQVRLAPSDVIGTKPASVEHFRGHETRVLLFVSIWGCGVHLRQVLSKYYPAIGGKLVALLTLVVALFASLDRGSCQRVSPWMWDTSFLLDFRLVVEVCVVVFSQLHSAVVISKMIPQNGRVPGYVL